jgi:hypothetical protein
LSPIGDGGALDGPPAPPLVLPGPEIQMKKFLRAVRLDNSDDQIYLASGTVAEGEWLVSGGYAVCDLANGYRCDPRCHCDDSFLHLASGARCTIAEVAEIDDAIVEELIVALAQHLILNWKAPNPETARAVAEDEVGYTLELCAPFPSDVWITVKRSPNPDGKGIDEKYDIYSRLMIESHKL